MKILCTGNADKISIAQAVKEKWSHTAHCVSRSTGWDLRLVDDTSQSKFKTLVSNYNVFINSSYVALGVQINLLQLVCNTWMELDVKGHIITIGSTAEHNNGPFNAYVDDKLKLRQMSLDLNAKTGITGVKTTYIILGGINNGHTNNLNFVSPHSVVNVIDFVLNTPDQLALLQLEKNQIQSDNF